MAIVSSEITTFPSGLQVPLFRYNTEIEKPGKKARPARLPKQIALEFETVQDLLSQSEALRVKLNGRLRQKPEERPVINCPSAAAEIVARFIESLDHEELWVLNLDTRNRIQSITALYAGSLNSSTVRVGELFRQAIVENAAGIVVCHNHPSGDPTPSPEDVSITRAIVQAGKLLDIELLDHLVIGMVRWVSLKERGLGFL